MLLNTLVKMIVSFPFYIVLLVCCSNVNVNASRHQFNSLCFSEVVLVDSKSFVERFNVTLWLEAPIEANVEVVVKVFEISKAQFLANNHLVNASHKVAFKEASFK